MIRSSRLLLLILLVLVPLRAQDHELTGNAAKLYVQGLEAEAALRTGEALQLFRQVETLAPDHPLVLQKIARQYSDATVDTADTASQRRLLEQALAYAQRAVTLDPNDPINVLSVAITEGKLATLGDNQAKVAAARSIKANAAQAISLDPEYAWGHHVLGRWHREVNELGGLARFFTKVLYGGLPEASLEDAVYHLERATALEPGNLNHHLELGLAYHAAGDHTRARTKLEQGLAMPSREKHDELAKQRARVTLAKLG
jgi:tetratricopeptide (TPR) repeat protein